MENQQDLRKRHGRNNEMQKMMTTEHQNGSCVVRDIFKSRLQETLGCFSQVESLHLSIPLSADGVAFVFPFDYLEAFSIPFNHLRPLVARLPNGESLYLMLTADSIPAFCDFQSSRVCGKVPQSAGMIRSCRAHFYLVSVAVLWMV